MVSSQKSLTVEKTSAMKIDEYGYVGRSSGEIEDWLRAHPQFPVHTMPMLDCDLHNQWIEDLYLDLEPMLCFVKLDRSRSAADHHRANQQHWYMPEQYHIMDIAKWLLDQCNDDSELQRMGHELLLFQRKDMFDVLKFLKYLVDLAREHNIVMGVGRGSSVASFALYKIGIHRINSLYYDLPVEDFLRD